MIGLGLNTLFAYGFLTYALRQAPAHKVSIIITMNPLLTVVIMKILFLMKVSWVDAENTGLSGGLGALSVFAGVTLSLLPGKKTKGLIAWNLS